MSDDIKVALIGGFSAILGAILGSIVGTLIHYKWIAKPSLNLEQIKVQLEHMKVEIEQNKADLELKKNQLEQIKVKIEQDRVNLELNKNQNERLSKYIDIVRNSEYTPNISNIQCNKEKGHFKIDNIKGFIKIKCDFTNNGKHNIIINNIINSKKNR